MEANNRTILMIGAFDSKEAEFILLRDLITESGFSVLSMDIGTYREPTRLKPEIPSSEVAVAAGTTIDELRLLDRGPAIEKMRQGAMIVTEALHKNGRFAGIIGMGGGGGTSIITASMRVLPIGVPKVCLSTMAGADVSSFVGTTDIVMIPSVCDICGINRITCSMITLAAGAVCGMVAAAGRNDCGSDRPLVFITTFGNTTHCAEVCMSELQKAGFDTLPFHANGVGGRTLESLVHQGFAAAVLDLTTTEWADTLCGGIQSAGEERLNAPGQMGIPHLMIPGCLDMVNFGPYNTVPEKYAGRLFYKWNPHATLMRTNTDENRILGKILAEKANKAVGPVAFLLPLRGISILDEEGQVFCDRHADRALFDAIKAHLRPDIPVYELDSRINDDLFARKAVEIVLQMLGHGKDERT